MLNEFDYKFWRSLRSPLAETKRHVRLATNISQVFDYLFIYFLTLVKKLARLANQSQKVAKQNQSEYNWYSIENGLKFLPWNRRVLWTNPRFKHSADQRPQLR